MALIICPECGGKVSEYANKCPHCGCPMQKILELLSPKKERVRFKDCLNPFQTELLDSITKKFGSEYEGIYHTNYYGIKRINKPTFDVTFSFDNKKLCMKVIDPNGKAHLYLISPLNDAKYWFAKISNYLSVAEESKQKFKLISVEKTLRKLLLNNYVKSSSDKEYEIAKDVLNYVHISEGNIFEKRIRIYNKEFKYQYLSHYDTTAIFRYYVIRKIEKIINNYERIYNLKIIDDQLAFVSSFYLMIESGDITLAAINGLTSNFSLIPQSVLTDELKKYCE